MITKDELKRQLNYDPETGIFTWIVSEKLHKSGQKAGVVIKRGYVSFWVNGEKHTAHRLAWLYMTGSFPEYGIDHINGKKDDNRFCNLRHAFQKENTLNRDKQSNNKSGHKGVSWSKVAKKWHARASVFGKNCHLGYFSKIEDAKNAYQNFAIKNHGEFYRAEMA